MKKAFKIILAIFAIIIIVGVVLAGIVFLDVAALGATGVDTLSPTGASVGKALVVYDPGLSGAAKNVANEVAVKLQTDGYTVTYAGIKSSAAANPTGYAIVVAGGPIYAGAPTGSVKDFLSSIGTASGFTVGVFGSGSGATSTDDVNQIKSAIASLPNADALSNAVVVKIGQQEDLAARAADFVTELTR